MAEDVCLDSPVDVLWVMTSVVVSVSVLKNVVVVLNVSVCWLSVVTEVAMDVVVEVKVDAESVTFEVGTEKMSTRCSYHSSSRLPKVDLIVAGIVMVAALVVVDTTAGFVEPKDVKQISCVYFEVEAFANDASRAADTASSRAMTETQCLKSTSFRLCSAQKVSRTLGLATSLNNGVRPLKSRDLVSKTSPVR